MFVKTTRSYLKLRSQIEESFNFAYIVCQAIPCLKLQSSLVKKGHIQSLPSPDYFKNPNPSDQIDKQVKPYKNELSKFILLSSFSYFESYVIDALKELLEFHGGGKEMTARAERSARSIMAFQKGNFKSQKAILSKQDPAHRERRRNACNKLKDERFVFPTSLLSSLGVKVFIQKLENIKSVDIPKLLTEGFHMNWSEQDLATFHSIRTQRNKIAHGDSVSLAIKDVFEMNSDLRRIAQQIDLHLVDHFFISEEFL